MAMAEASEQAVLESFLLRVQCPNKASDIFTLSLSDAIVRQDRALEEVVELLEMLSKVFLVAFAGQEKEKWKTLVGVGGSAVTKVAEGIIRRDEKGSLQLCFRHMEETTRTWWPRNVDIFICGPCFDEAVLHVVGLLETHLGYNGLKLASLPIEEGVSGGVGHVGRIQDFNIVGR